MIQVQQVICVQDGVCQFQLNILAREDATEEERAIAQAVEQFMLIVHQQLAADVGGVLEYIGPQHAAAAASTEVAMEARAATPRTDDAPGGTAGSGELVHHATSSDTAGALATSDGEISR